MYFVIDFTIVLRSSVFMHSSISLSIIVTFIIDFHNIAFFLTSIFLMCGEWPSHKNTRFSCSFLYYLLISTSTCSAVTSFSFTFLSICNSSSIYECYVVRFSAQYLKSLLPRNIPLLMLLQCPLLDSM
jgi:hypothetical protein